MITIRVRGVILAVVNKDRRLEAWFPVTQEPRQHYPVFSRFDAGGALIGEPTHFRGEAWVLRDAPLSAVELSGGLSLVQIIETDRMPDESRPRAARLTLGGGAVETMTSSSDLPEKAAHTVRIGSNRTTLGLEQDGSMALEIVWRLATNTTVYAHLGDGSIVALDDGQTGIFGHYDQVDDARHLDMQLRPVDGAQSYFDEDFAFLYQLLNRPPKQLLVPRLVPMKREGRYAPTSIFTSTCFWAYWP